MATKVYNEELISLQDDTEVVLRPLPIARLRKAMNEWKKMGDLDPEDDGFDVYVNVCGISLSSELKDKFDAPWASAVEQKKGNPLAPEYKEYLEEVLDQFTIFKILDICCGITFGLDPKAVKETQEAAEALGRD